MTKEQSWQRFEELDSKILKAVAAFVDKNGPVQKSITLPKWDYKFLRKEGMRTKLGRSFMKHGFKFYQLDVFSGGKEIVIG